MCRPWTTGIGRCSVISRLAVRGRSSWSRPNGKSLKASPKEPSGPCRKGSPNAAAGGLDGSVTDDPTVLGPVRPIAGQQQEQHNAEPAFHTPLRPKAISDSSMRALAVKASPETIDAVGIDPKERFQAHSTVTRLQACAGGRCALAVAATLSSSPAFWNLHLLKPKGFCLSSVRSLTIGLVHESSIRFDCKQELVRLGCRNHRYSLEGLERRRAYPISDEV